MSKSASVDLDRVTAKAWRRFRRELADRIAELEPGEVLDVAVEVAADETESGWAPYIQFCRGEADSVLGEVSGNRNLHAGHRLNKQARRRLAEIGWSRPRPKHSLLNFGFEVDQSHADQLAGSATRGCASSVGESAGHIRRSAISSRNCVTSPRFGDADDRICRISCGCHRRLTCRCKVMRPGVSYQSRPGGRSSFGNCSSMSIGGASTVLRPGAGKGSYPLGRSVAGPGDTVGPRLTRAYPLGVGSSLSPKLATCPKTP